MDDVKISPLAKRLAEENSIDWRVIQGTGPEGRVIERDILTYLAKVMSGEAELPRQPDVSEPPPPAGMPAAGMMPSLDSMGLSGASATLAREGVDLSSMLSDPVFQSPSVSAPVAEVPVMDQDNLDDLGDLDDAIFDLDLSDFTDESTQTQVPALATDAFGINSSLISAPMASAHPTEILSDFEPELIVSEPAPSNAPALDAMPTFTQDFKLEPEVTLPPLNLESEPSLMPPSPSVPAMDFSLTPSEPALTPPALSLMPEPDASAPVLQMPDLSMPAPIIPEPMVSAPSMPEPAVAPSTPNLPPLETTLAAAAAGVGLAATHASAAPISEAATSAAVVRDFFTLSALRRSFKAQALQDAVAQLEHALGYAPTAAFLARAAGRAQFGGSLALGKLNGEQLVSAPMPALEGSFRDLSRAVRNAFFDDSSADLLVLDASSLGIDDLVLPTSGALLSLGRTHEGQAILTLSGKFNPTSGAVFLERLSGLLEEPVGLLI